ncbi:caspase, EACC1-associated type [Nonomuraea sp. NPDC002799]
MTEDRFATTRLVRTAPWNGPPLLLSEEGARVLVAGTGTHRPVSRLPQVPAIPATLDDVGRCLVERGGLDPAGLTVLLDPATPANLGEALERAAREATSVLMFYYAGHGLFSEDDELHLATRATVDLSQGVPGYQALPYRVARDILASSEAELIVAVLDCCFGGGGRPTPAKAVEQVFEGTWRSAYVLASSSRDENSWALPGVRHTALSGALLRLLNEGDPAGPQELTLDHLYRHLASALPDAGFPRPRRRAANLGDRPPLAHNSAHEGPRRSGPPIASPGDLECPYRGLAGYGPEHAGMFFGRDELTRSLLARARQALRAGGPPVVIGSHAFETGGPLIVTGPSGCGKSSVLRAGLIPALRREFGEDLPCLVLRPGAQPVGTLAAELAALGGGDPARLRAVIESDPGAAGRALPRRSLLVVDRFEEVFTACSDERARRRFVEALVAASRSAAVVIAVRSEFFGRCASYPGLLEAMRRPEIVAPMTEAESRAAIEQPAVRSGLSLEAGLTDLVLEDLRALDWPDGVLPLLSHALLTTWQRRTGGVLTMAGYRAAGGVARAVATSGEEALRRLSAESEPIARDLLVRMIRVDERTGGTRRRVPVASLAAEGPSVAGQVLAELVRARLVVVDGAEAEPAHDALISAWPRLGSWVGTDGAGLLVRRRLAEDAAAWQREGQDPAHLYTEGRLAAAQAAHAAGDQAAQEGDGGRAEPLERKFLAASRRRVGRRSLIARGVIAVLALLVLVAAGGVVVALRQSAESGRQARQAAGARDESLSRQVAAVAGRVADSSLGAQLALSAYTISATPEARGALLGTLTRPIGARMIGHTAPVERIAYRPDGRVVATASGDFTTRLWNVADPLRPKSAGVVKGHTKAVLAVAFSPNGRVLATGSADESAALWDVTDPAKPRALSTLKGHKDQVVSVAFSPKGDSLATASSDGTVRLWNVADLRRPRQSSVSRQAADPTRVAYSPDGRLLAVTSAGGIALLDVRTTGEPAGLGVLTAPGGDVRSVAFAPDGRYLATSSGTGSVDLWDITAARLVGTAAGESAVGDVAFSPDGDLLAAASADAAVRLWDVSDPVGPELSGTLTGFTGAATGVAFSADGATLASSSADGTARLWNVANPARAAARATLAGHTGAVNGLAIAKGGRVLATTSEDMTVKLWNVADPAAATLTSTSSGHTAAVLAAGFSPDGRYLVTGSLDRTARLWRVSAPAAPKVVATLTGHTDGVRSAAYSPDGKTVVTTGRDGRTLLWNVAEPAAPKARAAPGAAADRIGTAAFRPDGRVLATGSEAASVRLWDLAKPAKPRKLAEFAAHTGAVAEVRFSPDGKTLATASADGTARLWDVTRPERPRPLATLQGHTADVTALAFSPDGKTLATTSQDATIRLWTITEPARPALWAVLAEAARSGGPGVKDVEFSPDGTTLAAASGPAVRLWGLNVDQARETACTASGMSITKTEWGRHIPGLPYKPPCPA